MSESRSLRVLFNLIREKFIGLNLFNSRASDPAKIHREIYSSRLLVLLLIISIIILTLYTSISVQTKSETIKWPSQSVYERLLKQYPNTLQCPCGNISILYGEFVNITPIVHQVCSSQFITEKWIEFSFKANTTFIWPMDIRTSLSAMWQLISSLCQSSNETIHDSLNQFANSTIISPMVLPEELLKAKTQASLYLTVQTASSAWLRPLTTLHRITQANGLMTGLLTNYVALQPGILADETRFMSIWMDKYTLKGTNKSCSCQSDGSCPIPAGFYLYNMKETYGSYNLNIYEPNTTLSSIVIDCLPMQTTMISSLECFYNQSCLNILLSIYPNPVNITILDASLTSRFSPTMKIEFLINELFIEKIFNETIYEKYYDQCTPVYCIFTYSRRFDWIYVITTLIALLGGLYTTLHFITPYFIDFILFLKKRRSGQIEHEQNQNTPISIRLKNLLMKMKISIVELNFFPSISPSLLSIGRGRIATRFYLIVLVNTVSILIVYTSLSLQTVDKTIESPSSKQYEEFQKRYSDTLQCPCSVISIPYEEFIEVTPIFHQLCSSDFVQEWWYQSLVSYYDLAPHLLSSASSHFRTLAMFCQIANWTIVDATQRFSSTLFVKSLVPPQSLFDSETYSLINTFLNSTKAEFLNTISLIDAVFDANQYISAMGTNVDLMQRNLSVFGLSGQESIKIVTSSTTGTDENEHLCYCVRNSSCNLPSIFDEYFLTVEGVRSAGCFVMDMVLQSSLLCWYDLNCIDDIRTLFEFFGVPLSENVTLLDSLRPSRFPPNTSIDIIVNQMMVEQWNSNSSYEKFYQKCNPAYCSYSYQERIHLVYIVTTILGLIGGLDIILRLICPLIARIFLKCINRTNLNELAQVWINQQSIDNNDQIDRGSSSNIWTRFRHKLIMFNLFDSGSTQTQTVRQELFSTRVYVLFLSISILIITIYTSLSVEIGSETILMPSQLHFEELANADFITFQCPCTQISIRHKEFTTINRNFHQICSSYFVKDLWLDYLFGDSFWYKYHRSDLRVRGTAYFSLLSALCTLSKTIIDDAAQQFLEEPFISAQVTSEREFLSKMNTIIQIFQKKTLTGFSHNLQLIRDITHRNTLISSYFSNWYWWIKPNRTSMTLPTNPITMNDGCSCATRSDCVQSGGIYRSFSDIQYFSMPGWNVGCSPVETLLRSTLECLYNQTCVDTLMHHASTVEEVFPLTINIEAMNSTISSRFNANTGIQEIVDALFVEKWLINISYASFYKQCAPAYCSYTFNRRNNLLYIVSTILGLYGGLTTSFRFLIPLIIKIAFKIRNLCCNNRVASLA